MVRDPKFRTSPRDGNLQAIIELHQAGKLLRAEKEYKRYLAIHPGDADALMTFGVLRAQQGQHAAALALLSRAAELRPAAPAIQYNKGRALLELTRYEEAASCLARALELAPNRAEVHNNFANALRALGRLDEAVHHYREAIRIEPRHAEAYFNLGVLLYDRDEVGAAADVLSAAAPLRPDDAEVHYFLGQALFRSGHPDEAISSFERTLAIDREHAGARSRIVYAKRQACKWDDMEVNEADLVRLIGRRGQARPHNQTRAAPFAAIAVTGDPAVLLSCARSNAHLMTDRVKPMSISPGERRGRDRIRLAYVAGDYRAHATSYLIAGLIEGHDRAKFDVCGISFSPDDKSAMRRRMIGAFDRFVEVAHLEPHGIAKLMREMEIDIAIDLIGYNQLQRMEIFAWRPAPIQVNFLGFPGTSGAAFMDYIIADRHVIPGDQDAFFSEKVVRLPRCYQANDRQRIVASEAPSRADCGLPHEGLVLCCFNNTYKITPSVFSIWMRLLAAVPGSVLWLLDDNASATANLRSEARRRGVDPARLVFAPRIPAEEHLARHAHADLFLDSLPYNAHTTASDALWTGVPVITCMGESFASRVAASLLHAVDLPELITTSLDAYEALALELARTPERLGVLRARLRENRLTCALFDTDAFRRHIESAYLSMWSTWQTGKLPSAFNVEVQ